jgi:hypothetical protein
MKLEGVILSSRWRKLSCEFVAAVFDAPIQNKRSGALFPIFDLRPPDALSYRDVDSHLRKLCAARGALGLVVGEGLDGLRLAVDFRSPLQPFGLDAFRHDVSQ